MADNARVGMTAGAHLVKNRQFYDKITHFAHFSSHKIRKKADIQNLIHKFVACTLGYISTNLWTNWTIFQILVLFSVEIVFPNFLPCQRKNCVFLAKNRPKIFENLQNFGNQ